MKKLTTIASLMFLAWLVSGAHALENRLACSPESDITESLVAGITKNAERSPKFSVKVTVRKEGVMTIVTVFYSGFPFSPMYFLIDNCLIAQNLNMPADKMAPFMTGKSFKDLFPPERDI